MSYSTIVALWPGEKYECVKELHNSWGTANHIWSAISKKLYGDHFAWIHKTLGDDFWSCHKTDILTQEEKIVFCLTFDRVYISKKDFSRAANDLRKFFSIHPVKAGYANHWPGIIEILESNPDYPAIGFWWTSVCENPFSGPYNEEKDDYDPFDWETAFDFYEWIDSWKGEK